MYTGTRPGVAPAIRAVKGWRDAGSFLPGVLPPELGASSARARTDSPCRESSVPHTTHTTPEKSAEFPVVHEQLIVQAIPRVVGCLPPVEGVYWAPFSPQVHQEQLSASEMTVDIAGNPCCASTGDRWDAAGAVGGRSKAAEVRSLTALGGSSCPRSAVAPWLDNTAAKFLLQQTLKKKKEEERRSGGRERRRRRRGRRRRRRRRRTRSSRRGTRGGRSNLADMKAMEERRYKASSSSKRKRKKRRKRRTLRTSSLPGRARRRQRQWFACSAGFTGYDAPCVMFSSGVARPKMLHIMAGMVQKGQLQRYGKAGIAGDSVPRAVFPSLSSGPRCLASWPVWSRWPFSACARLGLLVSDDVPRAVLLLVVSGPRCPSSWLAWTTGQCGGSQVQFLDKVFYMPVGVLCVVSWSRQCSILFGGSAVAVHHGRRPLPYDAQWQFPMVQSSADHRDSPVRIWWSMSLFAGPQVQSWIDG